MCVFLSNTVSVVRKAKCLIKVYHIWPLNTSIFGLKPSNTIVSSLEYLQQKLVFKNILQKQGLFHRKERRHTLRHWNYQILCLAKASQSQDKYHQLFQIATNACSVEQIFLVFYMSHLHTGTESAYRNNCNTIIIKLFTR